MEEWKDIIGYEGLYRISNLGNVKSIGGTNTKIKEDKTLKSSNNRGYNIVNLSKNNIINGFSIHRLVGIHFIPNPENKKTINHINGIRNDNRIENLEWNTYSENMKHSFEMLNRKSNKTNLNKFGNNSPNYISVNQLSLSGEFIKTWDSIMDVVRFYNEKKYRHISCVCNGARKTAGGFKWEYNKIK